jgi:hypothetical protein
MTILSKSHYGIETILGFCYSIISIESMTPVSELSESPAKLIWHGILSETQRNPVIRSLGWQI